MAHGALELRLLTASDDVSAFDCSDSDINEFLRDDALRLQVQGAVRVYLAFEGERLVGYVALLNDVVRVSSQERKKLGFLHDDHPGVPAVKVGRVGTCKDCQGRGIGATLLTFAKDTALTQSDHIGCRLLTLDAYPERVEWYVKNGFVRNKQVAKDKDSALKSFQCPTECPERHDGDGDRVSMRLDLMAEETPEVLTKV